MSEGCVYRAEVASSRFRAGEFARVSQWFARYLLSPVRSLALCGSTAVSLNPEGTWHLLRVTAPGGRGSSSDPTHPPAQPRPSLQSREPQRPHPFHSLEGQPRPSRRRTPRSWLSQKQGQFFEGFTPLGVTKLEVECWVLIAHVGSEDPAT